MQPELELLDRDREADAPGSLELRPELVRRSTIVLGVSLVELSRGRTSAEREQGLSVRRRVKRRCTAGPVGHADEVRRVDLKDVQRASRRRERRG